MKKSWPYILFMTGFQGWVLSLPLFGSLLFPLAAFREADAGQAATSFLNFYALSFLLWGILLTYYRPALDRLLQLLWFSVVSCFLLSLSLLWVSAGAWNLLFSIIGLMASLPSLCWIYLLTTKIASNRLGLAFGRYRSVYKPSTAER